MMASTFPSLGVVVVLVCVVVLSPALGKCGFETCHPEKPGMINVHMVCHTHTDPGWLITVDQYYYKQVQFILDGVVRELEENAERKFTYVEMSYLTRWWAEQDDVMKERFRNLVNDGRLEFTMGGWAMNDEAAAHYLATIDQHSLGFDFLRTTFGECGRTRVGWQIDPFGHSREQASIFAQYGFDGFIFGRLDYQDKDIRNTTHTMEFLWHGSPDNLGSSSDIFTSILADQYHYPDGFRYDVKTIYTEDDSYQFINDDPRLNDYNVDQTVDKFINVINGFHAAYATPRVLCPMGADWNYVGALLNFKEIDKLIKYVNARQANGSNINLIYSTPGCYIKALNDDNATWPTKDDDFFPYATNSHSYWTGFFTSRPSLKFYNRKMSSFLQAVRQLSVFSRLEDERDLDNIHKLAAAVSVGQHHDALAGTEKQQVAYDYALRLSRGQAAAETVVNSAYGHLMDKGSGAPEQTFCHYSNVSVCTSTSDSNNFEVTMYNPLSWPVMYEAALPVSQQKYDVYVEDGKAVVDADVFDARQAPDGIRPEGMKPAPYVLHFRANIPPLGFVTYFVQASKDDEEAGETAQSEEPTSLEGKYVKVDFDTSGHVTTITNKESGISAPLTQNFFYYLPFLGNNSGEDNQASGAYVFRPADNTPVKLELSSFETRTGKVVQELRQAFTDWVNQTVRVYEDKRYVEFEWTVGPIPKQHQGKEIISRYNIANWGNNGVFYTDSNGRELLQRKLNYRPTWKVEIAEPVAGNYFPVDTHIHIVNGDNTKQFTVLTDRAEGGTSLNDGDIELMLHRRLLDDDGKGVKEALDEPGLDGNGLIARGSHYVMLDQKESASKYYRPAAQEIFLSPKPSFSNTQLSIEDYISKYTTKFSGLTADLPPQVHVLSMQKFQYSGPVYSTAGSEPYLIRFEHIFEVNEDKDMSKPVTFDLKNLFKDLIFVEAYELALGGNVASDDVHRLHWKTKGADSNSGTEETSALQGSTVTIKPMQIVTLQVNFEVYGLRN